MMKKLVALLMALALLCSSIGAFAEPDSYGYTSTEDKTEYLKHDGHTIEKSGEGKADIAATCTASKYVWSKCTDCKVRFWMPEGEANGHTENVVTVPAEEFKAGSVTTTCTVCGEVLSTTILPPANFNTSVAKAEDYDLTKKVTIAVGAGNDGTHVNGYAAKTNVAESALNCKPVTQKYYCIDCGKVLEVVVTKGNHSATEADIKAGKVTVKTELPDCVNKGAYVYTGTCSVCGMNTTWEKEIPALNHDYDPAKPDEETPADCYKDGVKIYTCKRENCPNKDHKVEVKGEISTGHNYVLQAEYVDVATCATAGSYGSAEVCTKCGDVKKISETGNVVVDKLDHQKKLNEMAAAGAFYEKDADGKIVIANALANLAAGETVQPKDEVEVVYKEGTTTVIAKYGQMKYTYTPATCTEKGRITVTCLECDAKIDKELDALGHDLSEIASRPDYDCTKEYSVLVTCSRCDYAVNKTEAARPAHVFTYRDGYEQQLPGGAIQRVYDINDVKPCQPYYEVWECEYCTVEKKVAKEATEKHQYDVNATTYPGKAATCLNEGVLCYDCLVCDFTIVETQKATGHTMVDGNVLEAATCSKEGSRAIYCRDCGKTTTDKDGNLIVTQSVGEEKGVQTKAIPTIKHSFKPGQDGKTCSDFITTYDECVMCHLRKNVKVVSGHTPGADLNVTSYPSCEGEGERSFTCTKCHEFIQEKIPALGHTYQRTTSGIVLSIEEVKEAHACTDPNTACVEAKCLTDAKHVVKCTDPDCKAAPLTWTDAGTAIGSHTCFNADGTLVAKFSVVEVPTCNSTGYALYNCRRCGSLERYELAKLPHYLEPKFDEKTNTWHYDCVEIRNEWNANYDGPAILRDLIYGNGGLYESSAIGDLVYAGILKRTAQGDVIGTFGQDKHVIEVPVVAPKYDVSLTENGLGQIKLQDKDGMDPLTTVYARITWRYQLANGDTVGFKACLPVTKTETVYGYGYGGCLTGTFKLSGLSAPRGSKLIDRYVEIVNDADADLKAMDTYTTYGAGAI